MALILKSCYHILILLSVFLWMLPYTISQPIFLYNICTNSTAPLTSKYKSNLKTLLNSLSTNATNNPTGFYITAAGHGTTDVVYGLFMCRGDQTIATCKDCVTAAINTDLPKNCSGSKVAVIWYNECMVRYSNESLYGITTDSPSVSLIRTQHIKDVNGNMSSFLEIQGSMMNDVSVKAAYSNSSRKYGTEARAYTNHQFVYAMGQCTPDLSGSDCYYCLRSANGKFPEINEGGRVLLPSCFVRYEVYPFLINGANLTNASSAPESTTVGQHAKRRKKSTHVITIIVAVPIVATIFVLVCAFLFIKKRNGKKSSPEVDEIGKVESLQYTFKKIRVSTNNFSLDNKVGEGGFGRVYKGMFDDGQQIAVKRLSANSGQGIKEFKTEVLLLANLQHKNLVKLLGFCLHKNEKLLVYELLPNSSLDKVLLDPSQHVVLDWEIRSKIIAGVARALLYLHEDSLLKIIHRDLKPRNILLDESMNPKISDFGLAKHVEAHQIQTNTNRIVGTYGYMAPEYAMTGRFSVKSDVYSFGVIILEIISGHKCSSTTFPFHEESLLQRAWRLWNVNAALELVDTRLNDNFVIEEVMKCFHIGLLCIQEDANKRPTMAPIVSILNGHHLALPMPSPPQLITSSNSSVLTSNTLLGYETITEVFPR